MHISKIGGVVAAGALLAVPAPGLAAAHVSPANGKFTGTPHYKFRSKQATGKLTITVARHRPSGVQLLATMPPLDAKHSHGNACGAVTDITTNGHRAKGTIAANGKFHYTFTQTYKQAGKLEETDTISLAGAFRDAKHATGTFRDVTDFTAASAPGKAHCDSGTVQFSVSHG